MGKETELQDEVRAAVREYLGRLMDDGKPVTQSELLRAAKSAGYKNGDPPEMTLQQSNDGELFIPHMNNKPKAKPKYHWMVWRTSPTPTPNQNNFSSNSRARPRSVTAPSLVTRSLARDTNPCRSQSSVRATPPLPPGTSCVRPVYSPALYNNVGVQTYQDHIPPPSRTHIPTPDELEPDHGDIIRFPHTMAYQEDQDRCSPDQNPFLPKLRSWISKASINERQAAINLMRSMDDAGSGSPVTCRPRARTALPGRYNPPTTEMHVRGPTAGVKTSESVWSKKFKDLQQGYSSNGNDGGDKEQKQEKRSMSSHVKRSRSGNARLQSTLLRSHPSEMEYAHENSFFTNAQRPYRGHFIIHPEWVSELKMMRKERKQQAMAKPLQQTNKYTYD